MDQMNDNDLPAEYNDLDDINIPQQINPIIYLEPPISDFSDELTPLPKDDVKCNYSNTSIHEECKLIENQVSVLSVESNIFKSRIEYNENESKKQEEMKEKLLQTLFHTCCKCNKTVQMRDMFSLDYKNPSSLNRLICLNCAGNTDETYFLHDWSINIECDERRICSRCRKNKPIYKFKESNKYCDYCLLRKKWLRLKSKREQTEKYGSSEEDDDDDSISGSSDDSDRIEVRKVKCCNCNKLINIQHAFLYSKVKDSLSSRFICLNCSLEINNFYLLRDWEENVKADYGIKCKRCKKIKSVYRFRTGHSACEYCCLKRKRLYLLTRK